MTFDGAVRDTTLVALQNGLVEPSPDEFVLGIVRQPTGALEAAVDECDPALAPPAELLATFERRCEEFKLAGLCDEGAHNAAWEDVGVDAQYREMLDSEPEATEAVARLRRRLERGQRLLLVSDESAENRRSHRTVLRERLESAD